MRASSLNVVAALSLPLCFVNAAPSRTITSPQAPSVMWIKCPKTVPSVIQCGQIHVPIDHAKPNGDVVPLVFTRLRATGSNSTSRGLFVENGGPGEPNSNTAVGLAAQEAAGEGSGSFTELRSAFDLIGLDMRGTGASVPVRCDHNAQNRLTWPMVKDEASYQDMLSRASAWGKSCVNMTGPLIYHMGTDQAVRDLDLLRQALGYEKLNYLGFSYGSQFGSEYAEAFPDKVGRMVLDGVSDRHLSEETLLTTSAVGLESTFDDFFRWCNTTTECALYGRDQAAIFDAVVAAAEQGTLRAQQCSGGPCLYNGSVAAWEFVQTSQSLLHDYNNAHAADNWWRYSEGLKAAFDAGNATYFTYPPIAVDQSSIDNTIYSEFVITCSDRPTRRLTFEDFRNIYTLTPILAPHSRGYGFSQQTASICAGWPIPPSNPPHDLDPKRMAQLPPIMLVNAFYDPSTVSPWGLDMRRQIPTGFSIYRNGGGHTSWSHNGDTTRAINAFLLRGQIPADGTVYQS